MSPSGGARAFTLVEVLISMAVFAIGFAAIAIVLPAGFSLQKQVIDGADGIILANNTVDILKAKGLHNITYLYSKCGVAMDVDDVGIFGFRVPTNVKQAYDAGQPIYTPSWSKYDGSVEVWGSGGNWSNGIGWASRLSDWDLEGCAYAWQLSLHKGLSDGDADCYLFDHFTGLSSVVPYLNTNKDRWLWGRTAGEANSRTSQDSTYKSANCLDSYLDKTDLSMGKIHYFKNRPVPGFTPGHPSQLDFSYPSSILNLSARSQVAYALCWNQSNAYESSDKGAQSSQAPQWHLGVMALAMHSGDEWPELGNNNVPKAGYLFANDAYAMRSARNHKEFSTGKTSTSFGSTWYVYGMNNYVFHDTAAWKIGLPGAGGDPGNPDARLRAGSLGLASQDKSSDNFNPVGRGWWFNGSYGKPDSDFHHGSLPFSVTGVVTRNPAYGGADYQGYSVPNLIHPYALVYDYDNNLLLLRYPRAYGKTNPSGDARVKDFWARYPDSSPPNNWKDRKLAVGDQFLGSPGGYVFQVQAVLDPVACALDAPDKVDWSDGTYQVVRVTPPLASTNYTPNKPSILTESYNTEKTDPPLYQAVVGVPPIGGGLNPCQALTSVSANGVIFRPNDNMAD